MELKKITALMEGYTVPERTVNELKLYELGCPAAGFERVSVVYAGISVGGLCGLGRRCNRGCLCARHLCWYDANSGFMRVMYGEISPGKLTFEGLIELMPIHWYIPYVDLPGPFAAMVSLCSTGCGAVEYDHGLSFIPICIT